MERTITASLETVARFIDERAVDLDLVDREPLEVDERRVAGAEVVDREPLAHRVQELEDDRARRRRSARSRSARGSACRARSPQVLGELRRPCRGASLPRVRLRAEMLTAIVRSRPASRHSRCWRRASSSTQRRQRLDQLAALRLGHELARASAGRRSGAASARAPRRRSSCRVASGRPWAGSAGRARRAGCPSRSSLSSVEPARGRVLRLGDEDADAAAGLLGLAHRQRRRGAAGRRSCGRAAGRTRCRCSRAR